MSTLGKNKEKENIDTIWEKREKPRQKINIIITLI